MPAYHFRCTDDGIFEGVSRYSDELVGVEPVACPECGEMCERVWVTPPGIHADEAPPRDLLNAARNAVVFGDEDHKVQPFRGSTRKELNDWIRRYDLKPFDTSERHRGSMTPERKITQSPEFLKKLEQEVIENDELAKAGKVEEKLEKAGNTTIEAGELEIVERQRGSSDSFVKGLKEEKVNYG